MIRKQIYLTPQTAVLFKITGIAKQSPGDLSINLFDYLYGKKSPNYGKKKPTLTKAEEKKAERFLREYHQKTTR